MSGLETPSIQDWTLISLVDFNQSCGLVVKPFHFVEQLVQAGLELCADGVGLITTCCAAASHVRPLLRQRLRMLQEEAGYHLQTQKRTEKHRTGRG